MGRPLGSKMTPEHKLKLSRAMRKAHAVKRLRRAKAMRQQTVVLDGFESAPVHVYKEPKVDVTTDNGHNFPFSAYRRVISEAHELIVDRDAKGRNEITPFMASFPHGVSDVTFELKRRVDRILGAERKIRGAWNDPFNSEQVTVLRGDCVDLLNYSAFALLLVDAATKGELA